MANKEITKTMHTNIKTITRKRIYQNHKPSKHEN